MFTLQRVADIVASLSKPKVAALTAGTTVTTVIAAGKYLQSTVEQPPVWKKAPPADPNNNHPLRSEVLSIRYPGSKKEPLQVYAANTADNKKILEELGDKLLKSNSSNPMHPIFSHTQINETDPRVLCLAIVINKNQYLKDQVNAALAESQQRHGHRNVLEDSKNPLHAYRLLSRR